MSVHTGRLYTGLSQTSNPFLAVVRKRPITKFPCPVFSVIVKDCTERLSAVALSIGLNYFARANAFRVTWFERVRHGNALIGMAWEDDTQGLGMAMFTVVSERNRELLFIGNVHYKQ